MKRQFYRYKVILSILILLFLFVLTLYYPNISSTAIKVQATKPWNNITAIKQPILTENISKLTEVYCPRPYTGESPWNTRITENPQINPNSENHINALADTFGSNPFSYTYPVYEVRNSTPLKQVFYSGYFYEVYDDGKSIRKTKNSSTMVPVPDYAVPSSGSDSQLVIINRATGNEYGFIKFNMTANGIYTNNMYKYNTMWSGVAPRGFGSRGSGIPYLAGLIRKCEVEQNSINHAIAFAYDYPCSDAVCKAQGYSYFAYPATKSDGIGTEQFDMPEGTRLQLNPDATENQMHSWCSGQLVPNYQACKTIVKALQEYGMIIVDNSGHPKIYVEDDKTANWNNIINKNTVRYIPYSEFRVLN